MTFLRRNPWPIAVLAILPIVMLLPALMPGRALLPAAMLGNMAPWKSLAAFPQPAPWNPLQFDGIAQFYPWRLFAAETLKSGYLPLWNPYQFCGTPFLANDQSAVLYPPNLLFELLPVASAFGASAVMHLAFTGIFLYALLRRRIGAEAALLGAIIWQLSTWQISWLALPTFLCTSTWIPLALLQIERCAEKPIAARGVALGAIIGVMLLAGHLQVALYGLLICAAYGIVLLAGAADRRARSRLGRVFIAAAGVSVLLFAAQILPTLELAHGSPRAGGAHATVAGYNAYLALRMRWFQLVTLFAPGFFGRLTEIWGLTNFAENACFVSIAGVVLGAIAVTSLWRGATQITVRFFAAAALISMLIALGTPLAGGLYFCIPGFSQTGSPARILVLWTLSMAVLAAFGLESLRSRAHSKLAIWISVVVIIATLAGAAKFVEAFPAQYMAQVGRADLMVSLAMTCLVFGAIAVMRRPSLNRAATIALVLLAALDLFRAGFEYNPAATSAQIYPLTPAIAYLQAHAGPGRIVPINVPNAVYEQPGVLPPNAATVYALRDVQGYDSLQTGQYKAFVNTLDGLDSSPLENGNMTLTYARAALTAGAAAVDGESDIVSSAALQGRTSASTGDSSLYVYAEPGAQLGRARTQTSAGAAVRADIITDTPTRIVMHTRAAGDLIVLDQWYPGWSATVNGKAARIVESPDVFRTVRNVPAGLIVSMTFDPPSFRLGLYLLAVGLMTIAGFASASVFQARLQGV